MQGLSDVTSEFSEDYGVANNVSNMFLAYDNACFLKAPIFSCGVEFS